MALVIQLIVKASSSVAKWELNQKNELVCSVKSSPVNNRANEELCKMMTRLLQLLPGDVIILLGAKSRRKTVKINTTITYEQLLQKLVVCEQQSFIKKNN